MQTICALALVQAAQAETIELRGLKAELLATESGQVLLLQGRRFELAADAEILILQDGLYARDTSGKLEWIWSIDGSDDADWRALKAATEAFAVADPSAARYLEALDLSAIDPEKLVLRKADDAGWRFDQGNLAHRHEVEEAIATLQRARESGDLRIADTASKVMIGFPTDLKEARLYWPEKKDTPLRLSPDPERGSFNEHIEGRILTGKPNWFHAPESVNPENIVACLPFGGCGYITGTAVHPVKALWLTVDRKNIQVEGLTFD